MALGTFIHLEHDGKLLLVDSNGNGPQIPIKGRTLSKEKKGWVFRLPTESEVESMGIKWILKGKYHRFFQVHSINVEPIFYVLTLLF